MGQNYPSNPESLGSTETLSSVEPGRKEYKLPDVILSSQPRETESTCKKIVQNMSDQFQHNKNALRSIDELREDAHLDMDAIYVFIDASGITHGPELREEVGSIQEL